jgi:hypothetical protein
MIFGPVTSIDANLVAFSHVALQQISARCCISAMDATEPRLYEQVRVRCRSVWSGGKDVWIWQM